MTNNKSYPEEQFEQRLQGYRTKKRTKLPHQVHAETGRRVNRLQEGGVPVFVFPDDFSAERPGSVPGSRDLLPADLFDPFIQYNSVTGHMVIRGISGRIVLDEKTCAVALTRFFLTYFQQESCGQCTLCRIGTMRMREIMDRICDGNAQPDDIDILENLAEQVRDASLCEVGKMAAHAVLSTLRAFRLSYENHIQIGKCDKENCRKV